MNGNRGTATCFLPSPLRSRSGITLIEVLVSMGVLAVGVLGAASLMPLASYYQNEATNFDRGAAAAQAAIHDLQIKNYLSPRRWIFVDPANASTVPFSVEGITGLTGTPVGTAPGPNANYNPNSAFVIDPLGFSYVYALQDSSVTFPCFFPAFTSQPPTPSSPTTTSPVIYRAGITSNDYWPSAATVPVTSPMVMTFPVADRLMRSNDDLNFVMPTDSDLRPTANQYANAAAGITAQNVSGTYVPDFNGAFSWIATVSRTPSDMVKGPAVAASLHRFQVTVVVLQKRDLTLWATGLTSEKPPSERQVYAMFTQYGGQNLAALTGPAPFYGGGGLQLYVYEASPTPALGQPSRHWLDNIKPNTYLMLSANFVDSVSTGAPYPVLAWYRIVNVDDGPNQDTNYSSTNNSNTTRWYRNVTIDGGDWASMFFQWPQPTTVNPTPPLFPNWVGVDANAPTGIMPSATGTGGTATPVVFCTLMDDAIGEFEAVITLNYSLLGDD
jgi:type II secretory pathway pseudopilin PulG